MEGDHLSDRPQRAQSAVPGHNNEKKERRYSFRTRDIKFVLTWLIFACPVKLYFPTISHYAVCTYLPILSTYGKVAWLCSTHWHKYTSNINSVKSNMYIVQLVGSEPIPS